MSSSDRERRNVRLLLTARGVRAFGDGFVSILVPAYLTGIGFGAFKVGALTTTMLLGPAMMTLVIGLIAHRLKTVRLLAAATTLMVVSGIGYAFETEFWPLLIIALVGTLWSKRYSQTQLLPSGARAFSPPTVWSGQC
jgi:cyanate permease